MTKEILINAGNEETRIALLEDKKVVEAFVESAENLRMVGDIYKGKVRKVFPGMQAAFIDIGLAQDAFLHFSDIGKAFLFTGEDDIEYEKVKRADNLIDRAKHIAASLHPGSEILVQIIKEPIAHKGPRVSTDIALAGKYVVLLPNQKHIGVSKKIYAIREKKRLRKIAETHLENKHGTIIRTAAIDIDDKALGAEYVHLLSKWKMVASSVASAPVRTRIYQDMNMADSIIRDYLRDDINNVYIDSRKTWKEIRGYVKNIAPTFTNRIQYFKEREPIFDAFGVENDLQRSLEKKIWLKNGGYIIIEHTEALTSIDVNSGRFIGKKDHESNSMKINLEAVREITRQLRLRDIGGIIIIDFIDVEDDKNQKKVFLELIKEFKKDKAITKVAEMSRFGLIEMTRQRIRPSLIYNIYEKCSTCDGIGLLPSMPTIISRIERWIRRYRAVNRPSRLVLKVHKEVADHLLEGRFNIRYKWMWKYFCLLDIEVSEQLPKHQFKMLLKRTGEDISRQIKA
jgi:ribonuclease G